MVANLCLLTCALLFLQSEENQADAPAVKLSRGQEIAYQGKYVEEKLGEAARSTRVFQMDSRVFVLEAGNNGYEVAFYTVLRGDQVVHASQIEGRAPVSVRLELARVDTQGKITPRPEVSMVVPLTGPPTAECGQFIEMPHGVVKPNLSWQVADSGRPVRTWTCAASEFESGVRCLKLEGVQKSADWDQPRADQAAWRRLDRIWVMPGQGIAYKVERVIERRLPAHDRTTNRSVLQLQLRSNLVYPGQLFEGRRREIAQAVAFSTTVAPYLSSPAAFGKRSFDDLAKKIQHYLDNQPPTPYREAVVQVMRRVEAARRGDSPPSLFPEESAGRAPTLVLGETAPDFVATNVMTRQTMGLQQFRGHPTLMVFYNPHSYSVEPVLRFAQCVRDSYVHRVNVAAFALVDTLDDARRQQADFYLNIPILVGGSLKQSYSVEVTPKLVILDGSGIARASYDGWGAETAAAIQSELKRWLPGQHVDGRQR
jgi:hypothetical protein